MAVDQNDFLCRYLLWNTTNICFRDNRAAYAVGSASDSREIGLAFDTRSGHILSFLLLLIQEGQLSGIGKSMCMLT